MTGSCEEEMLKLKYYQHWRSKLIARRWVRISPRALWGFAVLKWDWGGGVTGKLSVSRYNECEILARYMCTFVNLFRMPCKLIKRIV
jgi:hypothetical protein